MLGSVIAMCVAWHAEASFAQGVAAAPTLRVVVEPGADVTIAAVGRYDPSPVPTSYRSFLVSERCTSFPCSLHLSGTTTRLQLIGSDGETLHLLHGERSAGIATVHRSALLYWWTPLTLAGVAVSVVGLVAWWFEGFANMSELPGVSVVGAGILLSALSFTLYGIGHAMRVSIRSHGR
jgi:hypothetical protein